MFHRIMNRIKRGGGPSGGHRLVLAVLGGLVYVNALSGAFIWDDDFYIRDNAHIKKISNLPRFFTEKMVDGYEGGTVPGQFYRPLQKSLYAAGYALWGLRVGGYHAINIFLHIGVALCLYGLIATLFVDRKLAWLTALLYVVFPAHAEVVANMTGTADPLSSVFLLLALIFYLKYDAARPGRVWSCLTVFFCVLGALFSKESALIFPFFLLFYHYVFGKKVNPRLFFSVLAACLLYLCARAAVPFPVDADRLASMGPRIPGFFAGLLAYIRILFYPVGLHVVYTDQLFSWGDARVLGGALFFAGLLGLTIRRGRRDPLWLFAAGWFFIFLLPASNIYQVNDSFIKDHWLYLPSAGFFLILARALCRFLDHPKLKILGASGLVAVMTFYSSNTIELNGYWRDPVTFFNRSIRYCPDYVIFYNELGWVHERAGNLREAADLYQKALEKNPGYGAAYANLIRVFSKTGRYGEAIALFKRLLEGDPKNAGIVYSIARCYDKMGQEDLARAWTDRAVRLMVEQAQLYVDRGDKYSAAGRFPEAAAAYRRAWLLMPRDLSLLNKAGSAYLLSGDFRKAAEIFEQGLRTDSSSGVLHNNLALALYFRKRFDEALRHGDEARRLGYPVDPKLTSWLEPHRKKR